MTDPTHPLHALYAPLEPVDPDPGFAAALRARVERALLAPGGEPAMSVTTEPNDTRQAAAPKPGDLGYASLWTPDVAAADAFYAAVLGWEVVGSHEGRGRRVTGRALHLGIWGDVARPTLMPCWAVPDVDETVAFVRAAGGTAGEPTDEPFGRAAECVDDQGLPFAVFTPPGGTGSGAGAARGVGDLDYYEIRTPDPTAARAFYSTVLGWRFHPGADPGYWHPLVDGALPDPSCGLVRADAAVVVPWFRVADVARSAEAVRAAGGTAGEPVRNREGVVAECVDDQGALFGLIEA